MTITLPPELEAKLQQAADRSLTTPMHADRRKVICWNSKVVCGG